jgi:hypothetical protein
MPNAILRAIIKKSVLLGSSLLLFACATAPETTPTASACYRPHWPITHDLSKLNRVLQRPFITHTGMQFYVTVFKPGPFDRSYYFVMSPGPQEESIALSRNIGVMQDTDDNGRADCFILGGGTLPDAQGNPRAYNFFAIDRKGKGQIEEFISEDLDLDGDRVMDEASQAVMMKPDSQGRFQQGIYIANEGVTPIPKQGAAFLLKKPRWPDPVPFQDNEVTQMTLFKALHQIWDDLHPDR